MKIHSEDKGKSDQLTGKDKEVYDHYLKTGHTFKRIAEDFGVELHYVRSVVDKGISSRISKRLKQFKPLR